MAGNWILIPLPPNVASGDFNASTMLLLTDGTVLAHNAGKTEWLRFTPDPFNGYAGGSWTASDGSSTESHMANTRYAYASGMLMDGRLFVLGGEYSDAGDGSGFTPLGEIYDPASNSWSQMDKPGDFSYIRGDAPSCVLADGRVLFGNLTNSDILLRSAVWDPRSSSWAHTGTAFGTLSDTKAFDCDEETWTLLPDGSVLTVNTFVSHDQVNFDPAPKSAERYIPSLDIWIPTSTLPNVLTLATVFDSVSNITVPVLEIGPAILLPDQTLIAFGATGHTARYSLGPDPTAPGSGTWVAGPDFPADPGNTVYPPGILTLSDAPAVLQPNGRVLAAAGSLYRVPTGQIARPADFFSRNLQIIEYDPQAPGGGSLDRLEVQPPVAATSRDTDVARFLLLPTGQILLSTGQPQVFLYSPDPAEPSFAAAWQPVIADFATVLIAGHSYLLTGTGLNGLSQANSYGDDAQMATNYPIVQITAIDSGAVYYLRTQDFSSMGVAVPGIQSASVTVAQGTPAGSYRMVVIANGIPSAPRTIEIVTQDIGFLVQENEFGGGQIAAQINLQGAPAVFQAVLFVVVDGFKLSDLGITDAASLMAPGVQPTVHSRFAQMTFTYHGAALPEDIDDPGPQRVLFPFQVSFTDDSLFEDPRLFPAGIQRAAVTITATLEHLAPNLLATAAIILVQTPNPFILHNDPASTDPAVRQAWYLSMDLRVFQVKAGDIRFGAKAGNTGNAIADATAYITSVIGNLNADPAGADLSFQTIPENEDAAALSLAPTDGNNIPVYNFALARVRTQDVAPANDVRVFFRMYATQQTNSQYFPDSTYAQRTNPAGEKIPILGVQNDQIVSIPFFATPRVDTSSIDSMAAQRDDPNVRAAIAPDIFGAEVHTFFGCWLDINQPGMPQFPALVQHDAAGPFTGEGELLPIQSFARSSHQCLIAEISYDADPIPIGSDPSNTDKLAQRNLAFVNVPNPGQALSRRVAQTFEIRPSRPLLLSDGRPDELMITWGNLPEGSIATVYLPAVTSSQILHLAARLYTTHRLSAADEHTVQMPTGGVSYVPIPVGGAVNFAGLLTVDLPATVKKGQKFEVVVRQITRSGDVGLRNQTSGTTTLGPPVAAQAPASAVALPVRPWRTVLGQFSLTIPVATSQALLGGEERHLSIMQWIGKSIPAGSRWYLVFQRYLAQLAGRVTFMGGDPTKVNASPTGDWQVPYQEAGDPCESLTGKIDALIYDHFGDFDGFVLETRHGHKHRFYSRECRVEERVRRACDERLSITVISSGDGREVSLMMIGPMMIGPTVGREAF